MDLSPGVADVSVVIPAKNRAERLALALDSVRAQSVSPREVIVVDDGSTDDTAGVARRWGATVLSTGTSVGAALARNRGVDEAAGRWIAFLDSDDTWMPVHLERSVTAIGARSFVTSPMRDSFGRVRGNVAKKPVEVTYRRFLFPENIVCTSTVVASRAAILEAGGFRDHDRAEDLDLWIRLLGVGAALALPDPSGEYHTAAAYVDTELATRNTAGTRTVLESYASEPWLTRRLRGLVRGQQLWDGVRHSLRRRERPARRPIAEVAGAVPYLPEALAGTFLHRYRARNF